LRNALVEDEREEPKREHFNYREVSLFPCNGR